MGRRINGEGGFSTRSDGRIVYRKSVDGQRIAGYGRTKAAAKADFNAKAERLRRGAAHTSGLVLSDYLSDYWLPAHKMTLKPLSYQEYERYIRLYIVPHLGTKPLAEISELDVSRLYQELLTSGGARGTGLSPRTVKLIHSILHKALKWAVDTRQIDHNPSDRISPPRVGRPRPKALSESEVRALLGAIRGSRWEPLIRLALETSLRQSELLGLQWEDVDLTSRSIRVHRQWGRDRTLSDLKTMSERTLLISEHACELLRSLNPEGTAQGFVFTSSAGTPLDHRGANRALERFTTKLGFGKVYFHVLRHSTASLMLRNGEHVKTIQQRLGHSSISTTLDWYAKFAPEIEQASVDRLAEILDA